MSEINTSLRRSDGPPTPDPANDHVRDELRVIALDAEKLILPPVTQVNTGNDANVAGRKILLIRKTREELRSKVKELKREIDKRLKAAEERLVEAENAMMSPLIGWTTVHKDIRMAGGLTKTIELDHCKVGFRKSQDSLEVKDEDKAVKFCEARNLPVRIKKLIDKRAVKDFLKDNEAELDPEIFELKRGTNKFFLTE